MSATANIQTQAKMRAADIGNHSGGRLQVVAKGAIRLKLQCRPDAALAGLLSNLRQRNLHPLDHLLRQRLRHIAGDDDRADAQLTAQIEPASE